MNPRWASGGPKKCGSTNKGIGYLAPDEEKSQH